MIIIMEIKDLKLEENNKRNRQLFGITNHKVKISKIKNKINLK